MKVETIKSAIGINILPTITYIPKGKRGGCVSYKFYVGWLNFHVYIE